MSDVRKSLGWSFTQEIGEKVLHVAGSVVIARLLTPDEMGVFALALAVYAVLDSMRLFGISQYLVREPDLTEAKIRSAFGVWLLVCTLLAAVVLAGRGAVADLYATPGIAAVLAVVAFNFLLTPFGEPARALLMRDMRFDLLNHITLTSEAVKLAAMVGLAVLGWSYMALAWGMLLGTIVRSALLLAVRPDHVTMLPSLAKWRDIMRFGGWLTGASVAGTLNSHGQKFVLGGFLNPAAVALYDRAIQLPSMYRMSLLMPITRVLFPALADDIRNRRPIGGKVDMLVAANTVLVWPAFALAAVVAEPLVVTVFGEPWREAGRILPYFLVAQGILAALPQPEQILVPHGKVRRVFGVRVFAVMNGLCWTVLGALHSLAMVAYLRPISSVIFVTTLAAVIFPLMDVRPRRLLAHYARALVTAAVCAAPALLVVRTQESALTPLELLAVCVAGGMLWLPAVFALQHPLTPEMRRIMAHGGRMLAARTRRAVAGRQ